MAGSSPRSPRGGIAQTSVDMPGTSDGGGNTPRRSRARDPKPQELSWLRPPTPGPLAVSAVPSGLCWRRRRTSKYRLSAGNGAVWRVAAAPRSMAVGRTSPQNSVLLRCLVGDPSARSGKQHRCHTRYNMSTHRRSWTPVHDARVVWPRTLPRWPTPFRQHLCQSNAS